MNYKDLPKVARHIILLVVLMLLGRVVNAGSVYIVRVADTNDKNIGQSIQDSLANLDVWIGHLKDDAHLDVKPTIDIIGDSLSCSEINRQVSAIPTGPDDAVFFYYLGHGYRSSSTSNSLFPEFDCIHFTVSAGHVADTNASSASLDGIVNILESKPTKPRLIVAIADACNRILKSPPAGPAAANLAQAGPSPFADGLNHLFQDYQGMIEMTAAVPGENANYWISGGLTGGMFTNQFLGALSSEIQNNLGGASWQQIIKDSLLPIELPANAPIGSGMCTSAGATFKCQHPLANYQLSALASQWPH